jgi:hypothetical protein
MKEPAHRLVICLGREAHRRDRSVLEDETIGFEIVGRRLREQDRVRHDAAPSLRVASSAMGHASSLVSNIRADAGPRDTAMDGVSTSVATRTFVMRVIGASEESDDGFGRLADQRASTECARVW